MDYTLFSNAQLLAAIDSLMARAEADEAMRSELDAQLADIYDALADPSLRDYVGAIDASINQHIALTDSMQSRADLLDALMAEYGKRMAMAMAASRTYCRCSASTANRVGLRKLSTNKFGKRRLGLMTRAAFVFPDAHSACRCYLVPYGLGCGRFLANGNGEPTSDLLGTHFEDVPFND